MKEEEIDYMLDYINGVYFDLIDEDEHTKNAYEMILKTYIKACKNRNIEYEKDKRKLFDEVIKDVTKQYEKYNSIVKSEATFDYNLFKNSTKLKEWVNNKVENCKTVEDIDSFSNDFKVVGDQFREYIAKQFMGDYKTYAEELGNDLRNDKLSNDKIKEYTEFTIKLYLLNKLYRNSVKISDELYQKKHDISLSEFNKNGEFMIDLSNIMSHGNDVAYCYHGVQHLDDAKNILDIGLLMNSNDIETTAYYEMKQEDLLLYQRGFDGAIGKDGVVIIEVPKIRDKNGMPTTKNIVEPIKDNENYSYAQSGLSGINGGPNYIIRPEHIVGYVDKANKKIVKNPKYWKNAENSNQNNVTKG